MSTLPVTNTLTALFVPIGWAGAVFAIACALVALVALARGAAGLTAGAVGVWFIGGLLSVASSFASEWMPLVIAVGALAAALVVGGMIRMLTLPRPMVAGAVAQRSAADVTASASKTQPVVTSTASLKTSSKTSHSPVAA